MQELEVVFFVKTDREKYQEKRDEASVFNCSGFSAG